MDVNSEVITKALEVKNKYLDLLLSIEGVVGVALGLDNSDVVIVVNVEESTDEVLSQIPESLDGFRVIVQEVGVIRRYDDENQM